jgi:hypothetical protein
MSRFQYSDSLSQPGRLGVQLEVRVRSRSVLIIGSPSRPGPASGSAELEIPGISVRTGTVTSSFARHIQVIRYYAETVTQHKSRLNGSSSQLGQPDSDSEARARPVASKPDSEAPESTVSLSARAGRLNPGRSGPGSGPAVGIKPMPRLTTRQLASDHSATRASLSCRVVRRIGFQVMPTKLLSPGSRAFAPSPPISPQ